MKRSNPPPTNPKPAPPPNPPGTEVDPAELGQLQTWLRGVLPYVARDPGFTAMRLHDEILTYLRARGKL